MERSSRRMGRLTAYKTISLRGRRPLRRAGVEERAPACGASRVPAPVARPAWTAREGPARADDAGGDSYVARRPSLFAFFPAARA